MVPLRALPARVLLRSIKRYCVPTRVRLSPDPPFLQAKLFHSSPSWLAVKTHILSDIGEGTKEVQIIQWFVEEGARVEEWAKLCEVQTDKTTTDISSQYSGVVKKLHYQADDFVQVGDGMLDIEVDGEKDPPVTQTDEAKQDQQGISDEVQAAESGPELVEASTGDTSRAEPARESAKSGRGPGKHASLATPAVRGLLKEHGLNIDDVPGSGRDGRVLKEDIHRYLATRETQPASSPPTAQKASSDAKQVETSQRLTPVQAQMFKTMTASLSIPHFLYSDAVNVTRLSALRTRLNAVRDTETTPKLSYLPFIVKAVSLALNRYPLLNARVDATSDPKKPQLIMRSSHNIGIAMDTPSGLLVPVLKSVNGRSISSIAVDMQRLSHLGQSGKLGTADLNGGTITVSNIGSIGGDVVAPVIVESQLAILGVGKVKAVPIFGEDGTTIQRADMVGMSWSADHRVVDGATMARFAKLVQAYLEEPGTMLLDTS